MSISRETFSSIEKKVLSLGIILASVFLLIIGISRMLYPFDTGMYEGGIWAPADLVIHGHNPFNYAYHPPYIWVPYGLFYYSVVGMGLKIFGLQFWFARTVSVACIAICCYCIARIIKHYTQSTRMSLLGIFLFLSQFTLQIWVALQRPDMLALALGLLAITMAITVNSKQVILQILLQALLAVAAIYTKQTSLLAVCIIGLWYLMNKQYSRLFGFSIIAALLLAIPALWLNNTSGGEYLYQQFTFHSTVERSVAIGLDHLKVFTLSAIGVIALLFLSWLGAKKSPASFSTESRMAYLLSIYFVMSFVMAAITASRTGSNVNYFTEASGVISMLIPILWNKVNATPLLKNIYGIILIFIICSSSLKGMQACHGELYRWRALPYFNEIVAVLEKNTSVNEPVYSDYPELSVAAQRQYYFNHSCQYTERSPLELPMQHTIFVNMVQSGKFSAIISGEPSPPPGYHRCQLSQPIPEKCYIVYLYLRNNTNILK
jgi:hypothetical protein